MARYLVVGNVTLTGDHLLEMIRDRAGDGPCQVHLLVPAGHEVTTWRAHDHDTDLAQASERLREALARFGALDGVEVTGEVGDASPVEAVGDIVRNGRPFDEVILSTLPSGPSRWLRLDVPARIERTCGVAVTHVVARREKVRGGH